MQRRARILTAEKYVLGRKALIGCGEKEPSIKKGIEYGEENEDYKVDLDVVCSNYAYMGEESLRRRRNI